MASRRIRIATIVVVIALGLALVFAAWLGWQAWQGTKALRSAVDDATALETALEAGDQQAIDAALARLREHCSAAADRTGGLTW